MSLSSIEADEHGAKKRRGDYVVLRLLDREESIPDNDIDELVEQLHLELLQRDVESPFYFNIGGSNGPVSDDLNESIDRLMQSRKIRFEDQSYELSNEASEYLKHTGALESHGISSEFQEAINDILEES